MTELGTNLLILMARKDIRTQLELEKLTGVSRNTISKILRGKQKTVTVDTLTRLCKGLDCDITELISIEQVG